MYILYISYIISLPQINIEDPRSKKPGLVLDLFILGVQNAQICKVQLHWQGTSGAAWVMAGLFCKTQLIHKLG